MDIQQIISKIDKGITMTKDGLKELDEAKKMLEKIAVCPACKQTMGVIVCPYCHEKVA